VSTFIGIPLDGTGGAGLGGMGAEQTEAGRERAERIDAVVVDWSMD